MSIRFKEDVRRNLNRRDFTVATLYYRCEQCNAIIGIHQAFITEQASEVAEDRSSMNQHILNTGHLTFRRLEVKVSG